LDAPLIRPARAEDPQHQTQDEMRTLLLHNPKAGDGTPDPATLQAALSQSGCSVHYCSKEDDDWKSALDENWDLIVIAGGDGTVAKVTRRLRNRRTPIAILPTGTANNIARSLGLTRSAAELAAKLGGAPSRPLDTGRAKGPWGDRAFIEAVGFGAVADAIDRAGPKPPLEYRIAHGREALCDAIAEAKPYPFALSVDDEKIEGEFLFVEILNLSFSGPRLPFAHLARPGDKLLDVVLLAEEQRDAVIAWIREKPEAEPPPLGLRQCRQVKLTWEEAPLRIDDRSYEVPKKRAAVEVGLEDKSLDVLCPDT
jgi:diacylglycerol kinase family enzyme